MVWTRWYGHGSTIRSIIMRLVEFASGCVWIGCVQTNGRVVCVYILIISFPLRPRRKGMYVFVAGARLWDSMVLSKHCKYLYVSRDPGSFSRTHRWAFSLLWVYWILHGVCAQLKWAEHALANKYLSQRVWLRERAACLFYHTWGISCMLPFSCRAICMSILKDANRVALKHLPWWSVQRKVVTLSWQWYGGLCCGWNIAWLTQDTKVTHTQKHKSLFVPK